MTCRAIPWGTWSPWHLVITCRVWHLQSPGDRAELALCPTIPTTHSPLTQNLHLLFSESQRLHHRQGLGVCVWGLLGQRRALVGVFGLWERSWEGCVHTSNRSRCPRTLMHPMWEGEAGRAVPRKRPTGVGDPPRLAPGGWKKGVTRPSLNVTALSPGWRIWPGLQTA